MTLVSHAAGGWNRSGEGDADSGTSISGDGRSVGFSSWATDHVAGQGDQKLSVNWLVYPM